MFCFGTLPPRPLALAARGLLLPSALLCVVTATATELLPAEDGKTPPAERAIAEAGAAPPPAAEPATASDAEAAPAAPAKTDEANSPATASTAPAPPESITQRAIELLGRVVKPGSTVRLPWSPPAAFEGLSVATPVLVAHGASPGPILCLTGAIHGDEINGVEIIRRVLYELRPQRLAGTVIGVPIVNQAGFRRGNRYLPDRRDMNRYFPGSPGGSSASRIAYSLFQQVIRHCDLLVDLHTGSFYRSNLPQLRADLTRPEVQELAAGFGGMLVLHSEGSKGTLRREATARGIPSVTLEAGAPHIIQTEIVSDGVARIHTLLSSVGIVRRLIRWPSPEPVYLRSRWVRSEFGGLFLAEAGLGEAVDVGERLGAVVDPITNAEFDVVSPYRGQVIGKALNQVVMPGYALFHLGTETRLSEDLSGPVELDGEAEEESMGDRDNMDFETD